MRTNRASKSAEARHRKPGPARVTGGGGGGRRALETGDVGKTGETGKGAAAPEDTGARDQEDDVSWHQTRSAR